MSKDIRSFFTVISKKSGSSSQNHAPPSNKKKPTRILDSDDEDVIAGTPDAKPRKQLGKNIKTVVLSSDSEDDSAKKKAKKLPAKSKEIVVLSSDSGDDISKKKMKKTPKKREVLSSDSEDDKKLKPPAKKADLNKLKPVNVGDIFKNTPINQSKVEPPKPKPVVTEEKEKPKGKKSKSKKKVEEVEKKVHGDLDFEKTLNDLDDDDFFEDNMDVLEQSISEVLQKEKVQSKEDKEKEIPKEAKEKEVPKEIKEKNDSKKNKIGLEDQENKTARKRSRTDSPDKKTPKKKKLEHSDSGIDPGQEAHEKKRYSAMLYQKYLNRTGPKNHGMKELPKGKPNCLNNLCFLRTGVLDSLESEEFDKLIIEHGGRVVHGVSKKVNYVVVGEDPGPAKLAKAESYAIPTISEDELLDLILTKSGMPAKYSKKNSSGSSEDLGIGADIEVKRNGEAAEKSENLVEMIDTTKEEVKVEKKEETKKISPQAKKIKNDAVSSTSFYSQSSNTNNSSTNNNKITPQINQSLKNEKIDQDSSLPLTEKYKPRNLKAVIGQQGDKSNMHKLKHWLENWYTNQEVKVRKALVKPSPWAKSDDGAYFKCALLSGPPGVGKTTTATLVARELGLDVVEFNASDTRSKRLLHEEVSQLLHTRTIAGFATGQKNTNTKRVLLMDEVDGMAGNEDRGGMQELIQLIKTTSIPIVCMCNDRNHQKMRSLVNYCFDLRFAKPRLEQIRGAMMSICFKERIDISAQALTEIITGTGCDIRQTLNHLAVIGSTKEKITTEIAEKEAKASKKDTVMGPWEVCRAVFTKIEHKNMSVADKARLFFFDYSLGPLFIQENYLKVQPDGANKKESLLKAALAASSISMGDIIDSKIRRNNNWSLLESQAFFSSVFPGFYMSGNFVGQINFPLWLGKNSKKNKFGRLQSEIQTHTRVSASASKMAIKLDYVIPLRNAIVNPLKTKGMEGIDEAVSVMKDYNLLREDVDSLLELSSWTSKENPMSNVDTKVKTAFTRLYNKQVTMLPFAPVSGVAKKKAVAAESETLDEEENVVSDNDSDEDISKNAMIKVKKKAAGKGKKNESEPGTSKKNEVKKPRGKKAK